MTSSLRLQPGFVVKTKLADGDVKVFVNICQVFAAPSHHLSLQVWQSEVVEAPSSKTAVGGKNWALPHSISAHRDDVDKGAHIIISLFISRIHS